jgi:hypothetical protein
MTKPKTAAFSRAPTPRRPLGARLRSGRAAIAMTMLALLWTACAPVQAAGRSQVPLPRPRPATAPAAVEAPAGAKTEKPAADTAAVEPAAPPASACRQALTEDIAIAPSLPPIKGPGGCGGEDLVRLEAIVLADKTRVSVKPAATLRCTMATAVADWVRADVAALASSLNTAISEIDNFDSFECRGRNRVTGALLSEHGKANALDVRSLKFADGRILRLTDRTADRTQRETVLHSVCARFSTVLGPDSDWYHEDHIHLDLAERRNNYRICEWDVLDPLPAVAPLLPVARPDEAPKREAKENEEDTPQEPELAPATPQRAKEDAKSDNRSSASTAQRAATTAPDVGQTTGTKGHPKTKGRRSGAPLSLDLRKSF